MLSGMPRHLGRKDGARMFAFTGPLQRQETTIRDRWVIVAEERDCGCAGRRWDVFTEYAGERVIYLGPNMHNDPTVEIARIARMLNE
jgi:hypothetical protein